MTAIDNEYRRITATRQADNFRAPGAGLQGSGPILGALKGYAELVQDPPSVLTLHRATATLREVSDMARWPGGTGELPDFNDGD